MCYCHFTKSIVLFSEFFYYVPVKVGFACCGAAADDAYDVAGLCSYGACCWVAGFDVGQLEGFDMVSFQDFSCFVRLEEDMSGNEFVLENVVRGFLLLVLLLYQILDATSGGRRAGVRPTG